MLLISSKNVSDHFFYLTYKPRNKSTPPTLLQGTKAEQGHGQGGFARASATHHSQTLLGDNHGQAFSGFFMEG